MVLAMEGGEEDARSHLQKVLTVLAIARGPAPIGYISLHTKIEDPLGILESLIEEGLVSRYTYSNWSCSRSPMFELTSKARDWLR